MEPGAATAQRFRGAAIGGFFVGGEESLTGLAVSPGGVFSAQLRGLAIGGFGVAGKELEGLALSLGGIGGEHLEGILMAGLGLGAVERIRGVALGGLVVFAPEGKGLTLGALNGLYIDKIDLDDLLHFRMGNERFSGVSVGLVNFTHRLYGPQLGLINYAANNPRWLRLRPLVNFHF